MYFSWFSFIVACSMYLNFSRLPFDDDSEFPSDYSLSLCSSLAANPYSSYLIAGGFKVHSGDFPHMAAIGFGYSEPYYFGCGGSLISPNFILTAAHCSRHQKYHIVFGINNKIFQYMTFDFIVVRRVWCAWVRCS